MNQPRNTSEVVSQAVLQQLTLLGALISREGSEPRHSLDSSQVSLRAVRLDDPLIQKLARFAAAANSVAVTLRSGDDYMAQFVADGTDTFAARDSDGELSAAAGDDLEGAEEAVILGDFRRLAQLVDAEHVDLEVTYHHSDSAFSFAWDSETIVRAGGGGWLGPARALRSKDRVLVWTGGDDFLAGESLLVFGRDWSGSHQLAQPREVALADVVLAPAAHYLVSGSGFEDVAALLNRVALAIAWASVASGAERTGQALTLTFVGTSRSTVETPLDELPSEHIEACDAVQLGAWALEAWTQVRREAIAQTAAATVRATGDLRGAARAVRAQAGFIQELAQSSLVASAIVARRSARESAAASAHAAASAVRAASRSTFDRFVAMTIGAFGVVIAQKSNALDPGEAWLVLVVVAIVLLAALGAAVGFELPSVRRELDASLDQLSSYQEVLPASDLTAIRSGATVIDAYATLRNSCRAIWGAAIVAGLLVCLAAVLVANSSAEPTPEPAPEPKATTTSTVPEPKSVPGFEPSPAVPTTSAPASPTSATQSDS